MREDRDQRLALRRTVQLISVGVLLLLTSTCSGCRKSWYTQTVPTKQGVTSVIVTPAGPVDLTEGVPTVFTVTVTLDGALHPTQAFFVTVQIYEDDVWGDVNLDRNVRVSIPAGGVSGNNTFTLTCIDPDDDGNYKLQGDDGAEDLEDVWQVYGYVIDQPAASSESGPNTDVTCSEP